MTVVDERPALFEYAGTARGEARFFTVYGTEYGQLQVTITRDEKRRRNSGVDTFAAATWFRPDLPKSEPWIFVAALGYQEIASKDIPMHGDLTDHLNTLRADADLLLGRALTVLDGWKSV